METEWAKTQTPLTGNRRYRREQCETRQGWETLLVLQVEYTSFVSGREDKPGRWVCLWRDATTDDLSASEVVS